MLSQTIIGTERNKCCLSAGDSPAVGTLLSDKKNHSINRKLRGLSVNCMFSYENRMSLRPAPPPIRSPSLGANNTSYHTRYIKLSYRCFQKLYRRATLNYLSTRAVGKVSKETKGTNCVSGTEGASGVMQRGGFGFLGIKSRCPRELWGLAAVPGVCGELPKLRLTGRLHHKVPQGGPLLPAQIF